MTEKSMLWDTGGIGDGANQYDQEEWSLLFLEMFTRHPDEGPLRTSGSGYDVDGELAVTAGSGSVSVADGRAIVGGFPYRNTAPVTFTVDLPVSQARYDLVVVKTDWATKLTRLAYEKNPSEGVDDLVTHHVRGDHWDIPLATVRAEPSGNITIDTTKRRFCSGTMAVKADTVEAGSLTHVNMANRTRRQLWPVQPADPDYAHYYADRGWYMPDGADRSYFAVIPVPDNYAAGDFTLAVIGHAVESGDYWIDLKAYGGRVGQQWNENENQFAGTITTLTAGVTTAVAETTLNYYALDGYIVAIATRYGTAPGDGTGNFVINGIRISYPGTD